MMAESFGGRANTGDTRRVGGIMPLGLMRIRPPRIQVLAAVFALTLAACGGSAQETASTSGVDDATSSSTGINAEDVAEANIPGLQTSDDPLDIEVLAVADGSVSSLRAAVTGDRPVLLWFWAPH
jgi:hypothetical protein